MAMENPSFIENSDYNLNFSGNFQLSCLTTGGYQGKIRVCRKVGLTTIDSHVQSSGNYLYNQVFVLSFKRLTFEFSPRYRMYRSTWGHMELMLTSESEAH